jgi:hypothetical protein
MSESAPHPGPEAERPSESEPGEQPPAPGATAAGEPAGEEPLPREPPPQKAPPQEPPPAQGRDPGYGEGAGFERGSRFAAGPPPFAAHHAADGRECVEWCPICRTADVVRASVPPEIRAQWHDVQREALVTVRALIDHYIERVDRESNPATRVEDIPIR